MSEGVIAAIITGLFAIGSQLIISRQSNKDFYARLDKNQAVTDTKLTELTREVRQHNGFAERIPVLQERIDQLTKRVEELERRP